MPQADKRGDQGLKIYGNCRILKISNINSKLLKTLEIFLRPHKINCSYRYYLQFKPLCAFFCKKAVQSHMVFVLNVHRQNTMPNLTIWARFAKSSIYLNTCQHHFLTLRCLVLKSVLGWEYVLQHVICKLRSLNFGDRVSIVDSIVDAT